MKMLINDLIKLNDTTISLGSENIKSAALQEVAADTNYTIIFSELKELDSLALYNLYYTGATIQLRLYNVPSGGVGLLENITNLDTSEGSNYIYPLSKYYSGIRRIEIQFLTPASFNYVGRIGAGMLRDLPIYKRRQPGLDSTTKSRTTLGLQSIEGAGGKSYRIYGVELKYKVTEEILQDYYSFRDFIAQEVPIFIDFSKESIWFHDVTFFYGVDVEAINFQSSVYQMKYSKGFTFEERF